MINNNDNSLYYEVFNRNLIKYSLAIMGIHNKFQIFNGIVQKKYLMDQIRLQTENIWWMNEFFELIFNENYKEDILEWLKHFQERRMYIHDCLQYYVHHDYLSNTEQYVLKNYYIDMRRFGKRMKRRLISRPPHMLTTL